MGSRDRMQLTELLNDCWADEPVTVTLRNGVVVKGHVHSRHRKIKGTEMGCITINEGGGAWSTVPDDQIESIVLEDAEWRRRG